MKVSPAFGLVQEEHASTISVRLADSLTQGRLVGAGSCRGVKLVAGHFDMYYWSSQNNMLVYGEEKGDEWRFASCA